MSDDIKEKNALLAFHDLKRQMAYDFVRAKVLRHDAYQLPERPRYSQTMIFIQMADTYTGGLVSELNRFLAGVVHADAWSKVARRFESPDDLPLLWEYAEPQLELSVGRPYSIKNQFIFAGVHLLHQSKKLRDPMWRDVLPPDDRINYNHLEDLDAGWSGFPTFLGSLAQINDSEFLRNTVNFRNRLQRYRTHFEHGITRSITREETKSGVAYHFGYISPIPLDELIPRLYDRHRAATHIFACYWELVCEVCQAWDELYGCSE